jgi:hypothetical protein
VPSSPGTASWSTDPSAAPGLDGTDAGHDHDPQLPARLHREHPLDTLVVGGDLFESLQSPHVCFERLAAGTGTSTRHRVGGLGQHRFDRARLDLIVVRLDRVDDLRTLAVTAGDIRASHGMATFGLVRQRLADVVQQRAPLDQCNVQVKLGGHQSSDPRALDQVLEHVLSVGNAIAQ